MLCCHHLITLRWQHHFDACLSSSNHCAMLRWNDGSITLIRDRPLMRQWQHHEGSITLMRDWPAIISSHCDAAGKAEPATARRIFWCWRLRHSPQAQFECIREGCRPEKSVKKLWTMSVAPLAPLPLYIQTIRVDFFQKPVLEAWDNW